jgi:hypothetical protein
MRITTTDTLNGQIEVKYSFNAENEELEVHNIWLNLAGKKVDIKDILLPKQIDFVQENLTYSVYES